MHKVTPPIALIISLKPLKSATIKSVMFNPVISFTVASVHDAALAKSPPLAYPSAKIELNITLRLAGILPLDVLHDAALTIESLGIETMFI